MTNSLEDEARAWPAASSSDFSEESSVGKLWKQIVEGLRKEDSETLEFRFDAVLTVRRCERRKAISALSISLP